MVTGRIARRPFRVTMRALTALAGIWVCLSSAPADACELVSPSPWFATEAELIATTPEIFVGRVIGVRRPEDGLLLPAAEYELEVLERLQGSQPDRVWIGPFSDWRPAEDPRTDPRSRGRVVYGSDCRMIAQFVTGERYLVFRDAYHPKGYELLEDDADPWLERVRQLVRLRASGAALPEFCSDVPALAADGTAQPAGPPALSAPVTVDGLEIVTQPVRTVFGPREPIQMVVTFRNRAEHPMRVPDRIEPPNIVHWTVLLERPADGGRCTGASLVSPGPWRPGDIVPVVLQPGESRSATVSFEGFVFADGETSREAAANVFRRQESLVRAGRLAANPLTGPDHPFTVPPGTYRVRIVILLPAFPTYPGVPAEVRDEIARLAADPVPLWTGRVLRSAPVDVRISPEPRLPN